MAALYFDEVAHELLDAQAQVLVVFLLAEGGDDAAAAVLSLTVTWTVSRGA